MTLGPYLPQKVVSSVVIASGEEGIQGMDATENNIMKKVGL